MRNSKLTASRSIPKLCIGISMWIIASSVLHGCAEIKTCLQQSGFPVEQLVRQQKTVFDAEKIGNDAIGIVSSCLGEPAGNTVVAIPQTAIPISGPTFNTVAEASQYVAQKVMEYDLGQVQVDRDEQGNVTGVSGNTTSLVQDTIFVTPPEGGIEELDRFSTVLGGLAV